MRSQILALFGAAAVLLGSAAQAANPMITLSVSEEKLTDVLAALGKAAGVSVELYGSQAAAVLVRARPANPILDERASFNWKEVSFARALRDVCTKYNLRPSRATNGYTLYPQGAPPAPLPERLTGLFEKNGFRLFAKSVSVHQYDNRTLDFVGNGRNGSGSSSMSLSISGLWETGDTDTIAGLQNVVVKDDRGEVLEARGSGALLSLASEFSGSFPDEWSGNVSFEAPHPAAKKLVSVEGDLYVYQSVKRVRAEMPLPYEGKFGKATLGESTIVVSGYKMIPKEVEEDEDLGIELPKGLVRNSLYGPSFRIRTFGSQEPVAGIRLFRSARLGAVPVAVGASGKIYRGSSLTGTTSFTNNGVTGTDTTLVFSGMEEAPVKLIWENVQKSDPVKLFTFRMTDIPLPPAAPGQQPGRIAPRPAVPVRPGKADARPYFDENGGTLTTTVLIGDKPATGGTLALGLAEKGGPAAGSLRWVNVEIGEDGTARLENLKPGTYRLMRVFRPKANGAALGQGRWQDAELTLEITAGKETHIAPLAWLAGAPAPGGAKKRVPLPRGK